MRYVFFVPPPRLTLTPTTTGQRPVISFGHLHNRKGQVLPKRKHQRKGEPCRSSRTSISLRIATKKILLLHRRTSVYEPRPNISPPPLRPRTPSAGRGRLHAPSSAPIRGIRGDTPRPAPVGAPGNPRNRRFLPSFGPWRGWLLLPDLYRHFRIPTNCSLLTANC